MMMRLIVRVAEPADHFKMRTLAHACSTDAGQSMEPLSEIGFDALPQFIEVFTPKRWELIAALKAAGPLTIYALAKRLARHYRNVHKDVTALMQWLVIEKDEAGHVFVPWDEIDVRLPLVQRAA
jgi:predicted transcriptional regulator